MALLVVGEGIVQEHVRGHGHSLLGCRFSLEVQRRPVLEGRVEHLPVDWLVQVVLCRLNDARRLARVDRVRLAVLAGRVRGHFLDLAVGPPDSQMCREHGLLVREGGRTEGVERTLPAVLARGELQLWSVPQIRIQIHRRASLSRERPVPVLVRCKRHDLSRELRSCPRFGSLGVDRTSPGLHDL